MLIRDCFAYGASVDCAENELTISKYNWVNLRVVYWANTLVVIGLHLFFILKEKSHLSGLVRSRILAVVRIFGVNCPGQGGEGGWRNHVIE